MPSVQIAGVVSGGMPLVQSGPNIFSGTGYPVGGIQLLLDSDAPGSVYIGLTNLSGNGMTITSGGALLSGGHMTDGMRLVPGGDYFIPKARLFTSGIHSIRVAAPAASSGGRLYFEFFVWPLIILAPFLMRGGFSV